MSKILVNLALLLTIGLPSVASAMLIDSGFNVHPTKIDDPDYFLSQTETGRKIKALYVEHRPLMSTRLDQLPEDFNPIIDAVHDYILEFAITDEKRRNNVFYVGPNGIDNGEGFDFQKENLPTKIVKAAFCFGFDPFIFTGLIKQESKFNREVQSSTGAIGFTQLTSAGYMEVSEQLGILGDGYHGKNAPELFQQYIDCYYGPEQEWVNIWDDGTVPKGEGAYQRGFIGSGRKWKYVTRTRNWMNEHPDRNFVYGAVLFKLYLGHFGNYTKALKQYNVSHAHTYQRRVKKFYEALSMNYEDLLNLPVDQGGIEKASLNSPEFQLANDICTIREPNQVSELDIIFISSGLHSEEEMIENLVKSWRKKGYCKPLYQSA